jgi:hypothetical protein
MNRIISAAFGLVASAGLIFTAAPAHADQRLEADSCRDMGVTNGFASYDVDSGGMEFDTDLKSYTFETEQCRKSGLRLYKTVASTKVERAVLRESAMDDGDSIEWPIIFCKTSEGAYTLELAYYYDEGPSTISSREKTGFRKWANRYAQKRSDCRTF